MIPEIITNYKDFLEASQRIKGLVSLFWIVEYSPTELGYSNGNDSNYINSLQRYTLMRNECLNHNTDFAERLDQHLYRIWTVMPNMYMQW